MEIPAAAMLAVERAMGARDGDGREVPAGIEALHRTCHR